LLGHAITVKSEVGRGSVFGVRVPIVAPATPAAAVSAAALEPGAELAGMRVLVVDDEANMREALGGLLTRWGCRVEAAGSGAEAIASGGVRPDFVLCDLRLGETEDGFDVLDRLKARWGVDLQGAIVTADAAPERIQEARRRGYSLLHKPVRPAKLRALVEQLLRGRAAA
jgi:CheY-like chemotaxis protein